MQSKLSICCSICCALFCFAMCIPLDGSSQTSRYDIHTISVNYPKAKRVNCTQKEFFEKMNNAGLKYVYDSSWQGSYYYDTSSLAPEKTTDIRCYPEHFWRVRNYRHGQDTIPEVIFSFSAPHKNFCVIRPVYIPYWATERRNSFIAQIDTLSEAKQLYNEKVASYDKIVRCHFVKDIWKKKRNR